MASFMYGKARQKFGEASVNWASDTIKAVLIDLGAYTPAQNTDEFISDIPSGAKIGTAATLSSKTNVLGTLDAADISITGLSSAPTLEAIAIYKDTGTPSTSPLLFLIDSATGLPTVSGVPGADIAWSNGSNKIATI